MAHLSLPNSELHVGVSFEGHSRVRELAALPGTALLFPGEGGLDPAALRGRAPSAVIVVDGTWQQARKIIKRNPFLLTLPRVGLAPDRPSNYRIRAEPSAECVSTIEAIVHLLGTLEDAPERFLPILQVFDRMVDLQIAERARRTGPPRRLTRRSPRPPRVDLALEALRQRPEGVIAVVAEANAWPVIDAVTRPELVQLVAERLGTGERFEAVLAPRAPLGPKVALHLELPEARLLAGEPAAEALARFAAFLRPDDRFCAWGPYAIDLLRAEGAALRDVADLRLACTRRLGRRPGGVEQAVRLLLASELPQPAAGGRAGRRLACLVELLRRLLRDGAQST
jgi:hypothetical protein